MIRSFIFLQNQLSNQNLDQSINGLINDNTTPESDNESRDGDLNSANQEKFNYRHNLQLYLK